MNKNLRKAFKLLWIVQEKQETNVFKRRVKRQRLNPYNPLTYIILVIVFIIAVIMFGVVGCWREIETKGLFKYQ